MRTIMKSAIIGILLMNIALPVLAQPEFNLGSLGEDKLIKTLDDVLFVIRQEYAVRGPDSLLYGNNNNEYYGVAYGPGVMIRGTLMTDKYTFYPYLRDTSFRSLGQNYVPEPTKTMIKPVRDSTFTLIDAEKVFQNNFSLRISVDDSVSINHDITIEEKKTMDCVIITIFSQDSVLTRRSSFDYDFYNTAVHWQADDIGILDDERLGEETRFGLLFYEKAGIAQAALVFGGFVEKNGQGKWRALKVHQHSLKE